MSYRSQLTNCYNSLQRKTDKGTEHDYINGYYDALMSELKYKQVHLLEIGVLDGESVDLWRRYFNFYDKQIIRAVDIKLKDETKEYLSAKFSKDYDCYTTFLSPSDVNKNVFLYEADAYTPEFANKFHNDSFDIIIDDGPHTLESQLKFIDLYFLKIRNYTGRLIIEDIQSKHDLEAIEDKLNSMEKKPYKIPRYKVYDLTANKGRYDDIIIEIQKH